MRILIAVHNLIVEKSHLMPWRTVCDVVTHMQEDGHEAHLISLSYRNSELQGHFIPQGTREIHKSPATSFSSDLKKELERIQPEVIFWPITWRESSRRIKTITKINVPIIFWFPGGVYSFSACAQAVKTIGLRNTLPYLLEIFSDKKRQVNNFERLGIKALLTMTQTTAGSAITSGWPKTKTFVIPPGKENATSQTTISSLPNNFKRWLGGKQFYLFMGPPSGIRGIFELLKAFDIAADIASDIRLVCLFRSDGVLDSEKVNATISNCKNKDKIYSIWQSLEAGELNSFMAACHAVTMPFVLVPSEIPLAIIEAMAWGKPIITTSPGGTGDFVKHFGLSSQVGNYKDLADAMINLHRDTALYEEKCQRTTTAYTNHPDWRSVSKQWVEVANKTLMNI